MKRILYIEDNKIDQRAVKRTIGEYNLSYQLIIASSYSEGMKLLNENANSFDLLPIIFS